MNITQDVYMAEARSHLETRVRLSEVTQALRNLMAVINGDGGHRADTFGMDIEAAEDCQNTVIKLHGEVAELKRKLEDPYKAPF